MGFIQSNHSRILYNNTMISFNMVEAARQHKVKRFLYTSSACIYPEHKQLETDMQVNPACATSLTCADFPHCGCPPHHGPRLTPSSAGRPPRERRMARPSPGRLRPREARVGGMLPLVRARTPAGTPPGPARLRGRPQSRPARARRAPPPPGDGARRAQVRCGQPRHPVPHRALP
jgi:hypothetical protein